MEDRIEDRENISFKITEILKKKKKVISIILFLIVLTLSAFLFKNYYYNKLNEEISEKYIKAGLLLSSEYKEKSKKVYEEIAKSKNSFYSPLALSDIIENDLELNSDKILELFETVESAQNEKEQRNLVQLKKALYLMKISKEEEGKKILDRLIKINSIWKEAALEILSQN